MNMYNILRITFGIFCIAFGIDKFVEFLPKCSLLDHLPEWSMWGAGVLEIILGILLIMDKYTKVALQVLALVMFGGVLLHILIASYDFSGALIGTLWAILLIYLQMKKSV